jgi:hypothetical protein
MKVFVTAALIAFVTVPCAAEQSSWFQRANLGDGKKTCVQWLKDRPTPAARESDISWVLGYLSARATAHIAAAGDLDADKVPADIDAICAVNADTDLRQATRLLAIRLGLEPMPN